MHLSKRLPAIRAKAGRRFFDLAVQIQTGWSVRTTNGSPMNVSAIMIAERRIRGLMPNLSKQRAEPTVGA